MITWKRKETRYGTPPQIGYQGKRPVIAVHYDSLSSRSESSKYLASLFDTFLKDRYATEDEAKAAAEAMWAKWLDSANLQEKS